MCKNAIEGFVRIRDEGCRGRGAHLGVWDEVAPCLARTSTQKPIARISQMSLILLRTSVPKKTLSHMR